MRGTRWLDIIKNNFSIYEFTGRQLLRLYQPFEDMSYDNWKWLEEGIFQWPRHDRLNPLRIQNLWKLTLQNLPSHTGCSPPFKGAFTLDVHLIRIGICIGQIRIEWTLIMFILHSELMVRHGTRRIYTQATHHPLRLEPMHYQDILTVFLVSDGNPYSPTSICTSSAWPPLLAQSRAPRPSCKCGTQTTYDTVDRERQRTG